MLRYFVSQPIVLPSESLGTACHRSSEFLLLLWTVHARVHIESIGIVEGAFAALRRTTPPCPAVDFP